MRTLTAAFLAAACLLLLPGALPVGPFAGPPVVRAASPQPSGGSGDTRSAGEAPGFVGSPIAAIAAVVTLAVVAVFGTLAYVRLTGGPGGGSGTTPDSGAHR